MIPLAYDTLLNTPVAPSPFPHLIIRGFVPPENGDAHPGRGERYRHDTSISPAGTSYKSEGSHRPILANRR